MYVLRRSFLETSRQDFVERSEPPTLGLKFLISIFRLIINFNGLLFLSFGVFGLFRNTVQYFPSRIFVVRSESRIYWSHNKNTNNQMQRNTRSQEHKNKNTRAVRQERGCCWARCACCVCISPPMSSPVRDRDTNHTGHKKDTKDSQSAG